MNKLEKLYELEEQLDCLYRQQNEVLGNGGDDLWIRDKIAEIEDIIHEVRSESDE